jgi:hypothetical protein
MGVCTCAVCCRSHWSRGWWTPGSVCAAPQTRPISTRGTRLSTTTRDYLYRCDAQLYKRLLFPVDPSKFHMGHWLHGQTTSAGNSHTCTDTGMWQYVRITSNSVGYTKGVHANTKPIHSRGARASMATHTPPSGCAADSQ